VEVKNDLPEGWFDDPEEIHEKHLEYFRELPGSKPQLHPLAGVPVVVVAYREGNDDILVRLLRSVQLDSADHKSAKELASGDFCVVHLTWSLRQEVADHPTLEFAGSFEAFMAWENAWGNLEEHKGSNHE
jgi:hypothetical protein